MRVRDSINPPFRWEIFCPACWHTHGLSAGQDGWAFNGDYHFPTFSPSLLVETEAEGQPVICHSFIQDGMIRFLSDCTHREAGKTVALPEFGAVPPPPRIKNHLE